MAAFDTICCGFQHTENVPNDILKSLNKFNYFYSQKVQRLINNTSKSSSTIKNKKNFIH